MAGRLAGRKLVSPAGPVRPTSEELRGVCLDMLDSELNGASVIDLFAGSGALGIEALSRGAARCDFVENHPAALHALKANVTALRLTRQTRIFKRDVIPFVERIEDMAYDIAFVDAPYGSRKLDRVLSRWLAVPFSRFLAVEHAVDHPIDIRGKRRRVGDSMITVVRARTDARHRRANPPGNS